MSNTDTSFTIKESERQEIIILTVTGYYTLETDEVMQERVREAFRRGRVRFVIDFSNCELINSPGVAGLMDLCLRILDDYRGKIVLCELDELKKTVFNMVGIIPLAQEAGSLEEAVTLLARG